MAPYSVDPQHCDELTFRMSMRTVVVRLYHPRKLKDVHLEAVSKKNKSTECNLSVWGNKSESAPESAKVWQV